MTIDLNIRISPVAVNLQTVDGINFSGQKLADQRQSYGSYYGIEWNGSKVKYLGANLNAIDKTSLGVIYKNKGAVDLV